MKKSEYKIISNAPVADKTYRMRLQGDTSQWVRGGQFCDVAVEGFYLRRPIAATLWDEETFDIVYRVIGEGTEKMAQMPSGKTLDVLTGLGNGFDASKTTTSALVVCGGLGASPCFSLVKELLAQGKKVTLIMGFNTSADIVLQEDYEALGIKPLIATMDGTRGYKGLVTDVINILKPKYDYFYTCGPKVMMKAVCELLDGKGEASLEERMGCGCGICYGCTCHTNSGARRVCADGPVFSKEDIVW